eukprot:GFKZ01010667.1.p2 GENE.GFKZ01010667.1~~GFKZ01010667.1.p2  ORF type:complete len:490 (+),score=79.25 GFKZ01010667.1:299-1768(+)
MNFDSLSGLTDSDKAFVSELADVLRKERAAARSQQTQYEGIISKYQTQILGLVDDHNNVVAGYDRNSAKNTLRQNSVEEALRKSLADSNAKLADLETTHSTVRGDLKVALEGQNSLSQALSRSREDASKDASLILQLREELQQLHAERDRLATESVEKESRNMELSRHANEASSKIQQHEELIAFLKNESRNLSSELAKARTRMENLSVSHDSAISTANQTNLDLSNKLAAANTRVNELSSEVGDLERNAIGLRSDFDRERADLQAQIENLKKLVEMHKEETKDAEIRLAGYTEVLGTLADERKAAEKRVPQNEGPSLDKHAEVLFKNLNTALDAKLDILESERHELVRARASEASMATRQQTLIREAETARREAQEAHRQVALLEAELQAQKNSYEDLRRNSAVAAQSGFRSPSVLPTTANFGGSVPVTNPSFGYGAAMQIDTPTPFRNTGRALDSEQALANVMEIRRRHEAILDGIRERRRGQELNQ